MANQQVEQVQEAKVIDVDLKQQKKFGSWRLRVELYNITPWLD